MHKIRQSIKISLVLLVILGFYLQHDEGFADNGDFSRGMTWITSGPTNITSNWPNLDSQHQEWEKRFFHYWIPYWKLDFPMHVDMKSSVVLLWFPRVFLNWLVISSETLSITNNNNFKKTNAYHSLFYGVLTFSSHTLEQLSFLELPDVGEACVNETAFTNKEEECFNMYGNRMSSLDTLKVIVREPLIFFDVLMFMSKNMQYTSLEYLGKYSFLSYQTKETSNISLQNDISMLNTWTFMKHNFFPKGVGLYGCLSMYILVFLIGLFKKHPLYEVSLAGLLTSVATVIDIFVAFFGDGKYEITKHLFLSNISFDIASIMFVSVTALVFSRHIRKIRRITWSFYETETDKDAV